MSGESTTVQSRPVFSVMIQTLAIRAIGPARYCSAISPGFAGVAIGSRAREASSVPAALEHADSSRIR